MQQAFYQSARGCEEPTFASTPYTRVASVLQYGFAIAAAAVVLTLPMLIYGPMVSGHDTYEHLHFSEHFTEQFWQGDLYPRWLLRMNHGLGSPSFFVYPPLPAFIDALLQPAAKELHLSAFRIMEFLAMFGSGISAFVWLCTMTTRRIALAVSILYMLIPYHLTADFYRRTALPECWALVWIPLVFYFSSELMNRKRGALVGLAVSYALTIISHLISVAICSLIPLAAAMFLSMRGQKLRNSLRLATGMLLGIGLASFYLVPALFHSRNFAVSKMISVYPYHPTDNLIEFDKNLLRGGGDFDHTISLIVIDTLALLIICGIVCLWHSARADRKHIVFWLSVCVLPVFLMMRLSLPVWNALPLLHRMLQFPWRFNVVLCVAALPILAAFLSETFSGSRPTRLVSMTLFFLILATWLGAYGAVWRRYHTDVRPATLPVNEDDGWFEAWSAPGTSQTSALEASAGPLARFLSGTGRVAVLLWEPRHIEVQTDSSTGGLVMLNQFYYPAWRTEMVGANGTLETRLVLPQGLLGVQVAPGTERIRLDIPFGGAEEAGNWLSLCSVLVCAILAWVGRKHRSKPAPTFLGPAPHGSEA